MKTISFFGHGSILDSSKVEKILEQTLKEIIPQGFSTLLIGCHGDFDKLALSTCLKYKKKVDKSINVYVVLSSLTTLNKGRYLCSQADLYNYSGCETIIYDIENVHFKNKITYSNKKMIDDSDLIICYVNNNSIRSGAKFAINYAIKQNKKIINLFN